MKKTFFVALCCALFSCEKSEDLPSFFEVSPWEIIELLMPKGDDISSVSDEVFTFKNRTSGESFSVKKNELLSLVAGLYDVNYSAAVEFGQKQSGKIYGSLSAVEIKEGLENFSLQTFFLPKGGDFVIEEIFFTSTLNPEQKQYTGTQYIKIFNNSDTVLYADGLAFAESAFLSANKYDLITPDNRETDFLVQAIYQIPGSGNDVPVKPGESLIICDIAIDHKAANAWAFDLSAADFEWFDESSNPNFADIDNPNVKNLEKWYAQTATIYGLHNRGFTSLALVRFPDGVNKEKFLEENAYLYKYKLTIAATGQVFEMPRSTEPNSYRIPTAWIVDGVNLGVEEKVQWNVLPPSVDAGYTNVSKIDSDPERYFKAVRRKVQFLNADGRRTLQDTNNSSADFNFAVVPSVIEEQGTVMDVKGNRSTKKTYDGVLEKK